MNVPYTYLIKHVPSDSVYYGVRYARDCHPFDLWDTYFTSSRHVKDLIRRDGRGAFLYEVRKTFSDVESARSWEARVLKAIGAKDRPDFINKIDEGRLPVMRGKDHPLFGVGHSEATKLKMRKPHKKLSAETRAKQSRARMGAKNPRYGKPSPMLGRTHSPEAIEKMRIKRALQPPQTVASIQKMAVSRKGQRFWTNGHTTTLSRSCPGPEWNIGRSGSFPRGSANHLYGKPGRALGSRWWNDGVSHRRTKDSPGPLWKLGRIH